MSVGSLAYVFAEVADLGGWQAFAEDVLGVCCEPVRDGLVIRVDERAVRIRLRAGAGDGEAVAGWAVADEETALGLAGATGCRIRVGTAEQAAWRGVAGFVAVDDPAGQRVELCWDPLDAPTPFRGSRPHAGFRTGPLGLGHVVWSVDDPAPVLDFYRDGLGFRLSDYTTVPGRMFFLHANPRHHSLAIGSLGATGLHHLMLEVLELDDLGRAYDAALDGGWPVITSLGRHSNDHVTSFYVRSPSGWAVEVGWGGLLITDPDAWQVRELIEGPSLWGHERTWVDDGMKRRQRELRRRAAVEDLRAPLHLPVGTVFDVEGAALR